MRTVIIESPYSGNVDLNVRYARSAMRECLKRGESPFASHLLFTQSGVLLDELPEERDLGIRAGFEWRGLADATVVYIDKGISKGMHYGIQDAISKRHPLEFRRLGWSEHIGHEIETWKYESCYRFFIEGKAPFSHFVSH